MVLQKIKSHLFPKGFTLIELIVVITILAILGTIGFLSIWGYSSKARDSARIGDVANISKSLDVSIITVGSYPIPDNFFSVTYSWGTLWNQGVVGTTVLQSLKTSIAWGGLNKKPVDPLDASEYGYSSLAYGKAYQIEASYEGDLNQTAYHLGSTGLLASLLSPLDTPLIEEAQAAPGSPTISYVKGNFGGLAAKTVTGSTTYILAIPSIMTNTGSSGNKIELAGNNALSGTLLFHGRNIKNASTFNPNLTPVFTGTGVPRTYSEAVTMLAALQNTYSGATDIKNNQNIATLLAASTNDTLAALAQTVVNDQLDGDLDKNGGGNVFLSGACTSLPSGAVLFNGTTSYSPTSALTLNATSAGYSMTPATNTCQWTCNVGLPIGGACACPSGATCETKGLKYVTPGTYNFTLSSPTTVGAVAVGGGGGGGYQWSSGGGGGGGLWWKNSIALSANQSYTVVVGVGGTSMANAYTAGSEGGNSYFVDLTIVAGYGGGRGGPNASTTSNGYGGGYFGDGGGRGGNGGWNWGWTSAGAGAGGYSGRGADTDTPDTNWVSAPAGGGGAGGGYYSSTYWVPAGGGVGLYGQGASGTANWQYCWANGGSGGGQGGAGQWCSPAWYRAINGGFPGGGGGGSGTSSWGWFGGGGAVRLIWGTGRSFPSSAS